MFGQSRSQGFHPGRTLRQTTHRPSEGNMGWGGPQPRQTIRQTTSKPSQGNTVPDDSQKVIVIADSDDESHEEETSSNSTSTRTSQVVESDDIIVTEPLTYKDFANNTKRRAREISDEGYGSFSSGLGFEDDAKKIWDKYASQEAPLEARERSRKLREAAQKKKDDMVAEAWLQERLARADAEKKRTGFLPGLPPSEPRNNRPRPHRAPLQGFGGGSLWVPIKASREAKENEKDVDRVTLAGEALSRYLEKDPENERTLQEYEEYKTCKEKLDRGEALVTPERERMRSIKRNVERREYSFEHQPKAPPRKKQAVSRPKEVSRPQEKKEVKAKPPKEPKEPKEPKNPMTPAQRAEMKELERMKKIEEVEKALKNFDTTAETSQGPRPFHALDCSPTKDKSFELDRDRHGDEEMDDIPQDDGYVTPRQEVQYPRKTVAGKGLIKEIVEQRRKEESPELALSDESSSTEEEDEDGDIEEDEPIWQYDVYRREIDALDDNCEAVLIGRYLNRRRAEKLIRSEICNLQASLQEFSEFELHCKFEQNNIREQALVFPSGRSIEVFIEKEVVPENTGDLKRPKKSRLPTKHYIVLEETTEMVDEDELFGNEGSPVTKRSVNKESYIFSEDANKQANRLFVARQTTQFQEDERFDPAITGSIDTDGRRYLHELEEGGRLFDKTEVFQVGGDGKKKSKVHVWVQEQLLRGPRN